MAIFDVDEKKRQSQEERLLGRVYGDQPSSPVPPVQPITAQANQPPQDNPDSFLMKRLFNNRAQATPISQPQPAPSSSPSRTVPVYNLYDPNGPEAKAGMKLATAVLGLPETLQERSDRQRRATDGHKDYMEGYRKPRNPDPSSLPGPSSDFNVDSTQPRPTKSFFDAIVSEPQERSDAKRRTSRGHGEYMAKRAGITGVHPAPSEVIDDPTGNTLGNFVNGDTVLGLRKRAQGVVSAADATGNTRQDATGDTLGRFVNSASNSASAAVNEPSPANGQVSKFGRPALMPREKAGDIPLVIEKTGPIPAHAGATPMAEGAGWIRNNTTGDVATMNGGKPVFMDKLGKPITVPTEPMTTDIQKSQPGRPGKFDYGQNYSTTGSENPNDKTVQAARAKQKEQFDARQGVPPPRREGELFTRDNSPGMKESERVAYNKEIIAGRNQQANTALSNVGIADERAVDTEMKRLSLGSAKKISDLQDRYRNETDPAKKKALEREYLTLTGKAQPKYQIAVQESVDPVTQMPVKRSFAVNPDNPAESFEIGGNGGQVEKPPPKDQLKKDQIVNTAKGRMRWTGTGFVPAT